jgi:hypothetical protein
MMQEEMIYGEATVGNVWRRRKEKHLELPE